jgi:hypothetical protein
MCCHVRFQRRQSRFEIADGFPVPLVGTSLDL